MRRAVTWSVVVLLVLAGSGLVAGGWYYSDELLPAPVAGGHDYDVEVLGGDEAAGHLTLAASEGDLVDLDIVGFQTADGLVTLHGAGTATSGGIERTGALVTGTWPAAGDEGRASVATFTGPPAETLGMSVTTVEIDGELGPMPAWRIVEPDMDSTATWAVLVHGRGAEKDQVNRALTVTTDMGLPGLTIAVRNDPDAPADPDGWGRFGDVEWRDLEVAVDHLRDVEAAESIVLVGYSQGGGIILNYLRRAEDVEDVEAAVLISPLVSMHATLVQQAEARDIPGPLIPPLLAAAKTVTRLRSGMEFSRLEHARDADELSVPLLVTHGTADSTVPVEPTRELARERPDLVTYEEYDGVEHVREWNADRVRFDADLRAFLREHAPVPAG
jgi:pimeloyl-ACP methyl ester carboxylesterase